jgi:hypothetical protein
MAWVNTAIDIEFQEITHGAEVYEMEFERFSGTDSDPISQWVKRARAKGDFDSSDDTLMFLIVELHRKVDKLAKIVTNEMPELIHLQSKSVVELGWYEELCIINDDFNAGSKYYARLKLPTFPSREVPMFLEATDTKSAKIMKIHERDRKDWDSYLVTKEREQILDKKALN